MEIKMARADERMDFGFELKKEDVSANGVFEGYASTFGGPPDRGGDVVAKGCFTRTLKDKGASGIAMLWSHDTRAPIGVWTEFREDEKGLFCKGQVEPTAAPDGIPVYKLMRMGGIKGLSIGYKTITADRDETKGIRTLKEVELYEVSPVTFPMNVRAGVTAVKGIFEARTSRELERALRDAELPVDAAKYLVKLCTPGLRDAGACAGATGSQELDGILAALRETNNKVEADLRLAKFSSAVQ